MVRNLHGGKSHKRIKRDRVLRPNEIMHKDDGQMYGIVTSMLGDYRVLVTCEDRIERIGTIRGSIRKHVWVSKNMYVLVSTRGFDDTKVDVIHGYSYEHSKVLGLDKLFAAEDQQDNTVEFDYDSSSDIENI